MTASVLKMFEPMTLPSARPYSPLRAPTTDTASSGRLAVIGVAGVIRPATLDPDAVVLHLPVMLGFTLMFFFFAYDSGDTIRIGRGAGGLALACFIAYLAYLVSTVI